MAASPRLFPREHGAYAVLVCAWCCGIALSREFNLGSVALLLSGLALFVAQEPFKAIQRGSRSIRQPQERRIAWRQFTVLVGIGFVSLTAVAFEAPRILAVLPLGALIAYGCYELHRRRASMVAQSVAGFGLLSLLAPMVYFQSPDASFLRGAQLWLELVLFFTAASLTVGVRLKANSRINCVRFYALALPLATVAFGLGYYSLAGALALSLNAGRFLWISTNLGKYLSLSLKRIGIHETIAAVALVLIYFLVS